MSGEDSDVGINPAHERERPGDGIDARGNVARYAALLHGIAAGPDQQVAARALARALGAHDLLVFLRDDELGVLLPGPGFPQTLPDGRTWRAFLDRCIEAGKEGVDVSGSEPVEPQYPTGRLRAPGSTDMTDVTGIATGRDAVLVLLGGSPGRSAVAVVAPFLPLVISALGNKRSASVANAHVRIARDAASRAEALAGSLDTARTALSHALDGVRESRASLEEQSTVLRAANEELESQSEELQAINEELEQQTEELTQQTIAAEAATQAMERAREEARQAQTVAENANRSKAEFLAAMSHELRTPLNAIGGYVQLIELGIHGTLTAAQREALDRVQRNQRHLLSLINDVLNFAKLEAGRVEYRIETLRLADVVADLAPMIESQFAEKGLTYESRIAPDVTVRADGDKIRQILLNLLSNAVKFTDRGGRVTIEAPLGDDADPRVGYLCVSDTGCGIPPDKQDSVFDPFVQVSRDPAHKHDGTGLGLAISRDLARGMGGDLWVRSAEGKGSTFTLSLPIG